MPTYVKVRGLQRKPAQIRLRGALNAPNAIMVGGKTSVTVDLDDPKTRNDIADHHAIGQIIVTASAQAQRAVGGTPVVVRSGVVASAPQGGLAIPVSGGTLLRNDGTTQAVAATTVTAGAAPGTGLRVDLIQVATATGAVTLKAGTAAVTGAGAPAPDAGNIGVANVYVPAGATTPQLVDDVRPLP
jgi:hypothetical protein